MLGAAGRVRAHLVACQRGDPPALREAAAVGARPHGRGLPPLWLRLIGWSVWWASDRFRVA